LPADAQGGQYQRTFAATEIKQAAVETQGGNKDAFERTSATTGHEPSLIRP